MAVTINKNALQRIASLQLQGKNSYEEDLRKFMAGDAATIEKWEMPLTSTDRQDRNNAIFDHWLAGETTTAVAKKLYLTQQLVSEVIKETSNTRLETLCISETPPVYNVWNYNSCDPRFGQDHPGRIPGQAIVHLLSSLVPVFERLLTGVELEVVILGELNNPSSDYFPIFHGVIIAPSASPGLTNGIA